MKFTIEMSELELLVLKKLALINNALGVALSDPRSADEQKALTRVLVDICARADTALVKAMTADAPSTPPRA